MVVWEGDTDCESSDCACDSVGVNEGVADIDAVSDSVAELDVPAEGSCEGVAACDGVGDSEHWITVVAPAAQHGQGPEQAGDCRLVVLPNVPGGQSSGGTPPGQ